VSIKNIIYFQDENRVGETAEWFLRLYINEVEKDVHRSYLFSEGLILISSCILQETYKLKRHANFIL
jgi:hypothetical protein